MTDTKKLLALRKVMKKRKPYFVVKEAHYGKRIQHRWRYPQGIHSQVRRMEKGKPPMPTPGYRAPKAVRGLHPRGAQPVLVHTASVLLSIDPAHQGAIIASSVGNKKRLELLTLALEKKIPILNVKDIPQTLKRLTEEFSLRKQHGAEKQTQRSKKEEEKKKRAAEKEKKSEKKKGETVKKQEGVEEAIVKEEELKEQREIAEKTIIQK